MKFNDKLTALRKQKGMSQEQLAELLGVSRQAVSRWELGTTMPDAEKLIKLKEVFGVSIDYLITEEFLGEETVLIYELKRSLKSLKQRVLAHPIWKWGCWTIAVLMIIGGIATGRYGIWGQTVRDPDFAQYISGKDEDYFCGVRDGMFNKTYSHLLDSQWENIYLPGEIPGNGTASQFCILGDTLQADYNCGSAVNMRRVRLLQKNGSEKLECEQLMHLVQEWQYTEKRNARTFELYGKEFYAEYMDFYNSDTKELVKTVTSLWWTEDGFSFFLESDYSIEDLEPFFESMHKIEVTTDVLKK